MLTAPVVVLAAAATPAAAQTYDWSGIYVGAHGGAVDVNSHWDGASVYQTVDGGEGAFTTSSQSVDFTEEPSSNEIAGGGRIGFNWQAGTFVLGAEADINLFGFNEAVTNSNAAGTYTVRSQASNLQTVRARAGVAFGSAMIFATGGVAFSNLEHSLTASNVSEVIIDGGEGGDTVGTSTQSLVAGVDSGTGWALGGGGELAVAENLSIALTVLHVDFGSEELADSEAPGAISATVDTNMIVGMLGVNFRF
jgi:outer membrane immunogenic protein